MARRTLKWLAALVLLPPLLVILWIAVFGWNWARGPLQRITLEKTGRELVIGGELKVSLAWPAPRVSAQAVTFANPPWAREKHIIAVDEVQLTVDLPGLLRKKLMFPDVRLVRPVVFLETAPDGRKTWLLDRAQTDESARIPIGRLALDHGRLGYDDAKQNTSIRSELSTQALEAGSAGAAGVLFSAKGLYKGLGLSAKGMGGSILALHDEDTPYPLKADATVGRTGIKSEGTVTSLLRFTAMDMQLALRGESLALLLPLLGIAFPETHAYATAGRVVHSGSTWRYEKFSGHVGKSDIAGSLQVDMAGQRPFMRADLVSRVLDLDDLGPMIGARDKPPASAVKKVARAGAGERMLPDLPFRTERWNSVDADVTLRAGKILRAKELPLENLVAHLKLNDSRLTLDPLDFAFAGGHLKAVISLDGRQNPIEARARIGARKLLLARLFPTVDLARTSVGQVNGDFDLAGEGNSVGRMLATADGRIGLVIANGEISRLLMEKMGLHLLEILHLKLMGDRTVKLRCGVADFGVRQGVMKANALLLDTEVSTIAGSGTIDLEREKLDLVLVPKTRSTSPVALRSPIYVRGTFSEPQVDVDRGRIAARAAGALALGLVNPLLALIPLVEMGPGIKSECGRLIHQAQAPLPVARVVAAPRIPK